MSILNVEIKAHCHDADAVREVLKAHHADYKGLDHQVDTYFRVPQGRMKLRQGTIENNLIYYERGNTAEPKASSIRLHPVQESASLHALLNDALGVQIVVDKQREIYFIDNVKFHIDTVDELGHFVEIEAIDTDGSIGEERLREQCNRYMELLGIREEDLVAVSYSDLISKR